MIKIDVIADTPDYLVINKPSGVLVHPTNKGETDTLTAWLLEHYPEIKNVGDSPERPGLVHRLDKDASGVMVIAKTPAAFAHLKQQFQERIIEKEYIVLVHGKMDKEEGVIDFPIDRGIEGRMAAKPKIPKISLQAIDEGDMGKEATTEWLVKQRFTRFTLLDVKIHTGRMHQIRVHMLAYNRPVVGDTLYFNRKLNLKRDKELGRLFLL